MADLWSGTIWPIAVIVFYILLIAVPLLVAMAYLTYAERKIIGAMQLRQGPMTVGPYGLLQPLADGVKLFFKETVIPTGANKVVFLLAPMVTFVLALIGWAVIPFGDGLVLADINVGILYLFAISSLGVYGIIMAGWASNSRYAFLGALALVGADGLLRDRHRPDHHHVLITVGSLNLSEIVLAQQGLWYVIPHFPMFMIFLVSILAETNRHPFDLPEDEADPGHRLQRRILVDDLRPVLPRRIHEHDPDERHLRRSSSSAAGCHRSTSLRSRWIPGPIWFILKICLVLFSSSGPGRRCRATATTS